MAQQVYEFVFRNGGGANTPGSSPPVQTQPTTTTPTSGPELPTSPPPQPEPPQQGLTPGQAQSLIEGALNASKQAGQGAPAAPQPQPQPTTPVPQPGTPPQAPAAGPTPPPSPTSPPTTPAGPPQPPTSPQAPQPAAPQPGPPIPQPSPPAQQPPQQALPQPAPSPQSQQGGQAGQPPLPGSPPPQPTTPQPFNWPQQPGSQPPQPQPSIQQIVAQVLGALGSAAQVPGGGQIAALAGASGPLALGLAGIGAAGYALNSYRQDIDAMTQFSPDLARAKASSDLKETMRLIDQANRYGQTDAKISERANDASRAAWQFWVTEGRNLITSPGNPLNELHALYEAIVEFNRQGIMTREENRKLNQSIIDEFRRGYEHLPPPPPFDTSSSILDEHHEHRHVITGL